MQLVHDSPFPSPPLSSQFTRLILSPPAEENKQPRSSRTKKGADPNGTWTFLTALLISNCVKPVKGEELIELVERMAEQSARQHAAQTPQPDEVGSDIVLAPAGAPVSAFDLDDAVKHCYGKYTMFQEIVGCLFSEADQLLEQMRTALANGNATDSANAAHRLKGTVAYLGAPPAMDATRRVEQMGKCHELVEAAEAICELERQLATLKAALASHRRE